MKDDGTRIPEVGPQACVSLMQELWYCLLERL